MLSAGLTDPDDAPEAPADPVSRLGDVWILGAHRLVCGDATSAADVARALNGVAPTLMVSDPPYGVDYDPSWRARAGVNLNPGKLGKVDNDDQADWSAAWALFPGDVAYVWHAGKFAATVQASLESCEFEVRSQIIWAKDRFALSRGDYHWQHEPCWYAVRRNARGGWSGDRSQSTLWTIPSREDQGFGPWHPEAGGVHAAADRQQLLARAGGVRPLRRLRHDDHRRRDDGPLRARARAQPGLRRRGGDPVAGLHGQDGGPGTDGRKLRDDGGDEICQPFGGGRYRG